MSSLRSRLLLSRALERLVAIARGAVSPMMAVASPAPEPEASPGAETPPARPRGGGSPLALSLKLLSLLTLGYTGAFVALNPGADPWVLLGVLLGGIGLALTEWSLATSSR